MNIKIITLYKVDEIGIRERSADRILQYFVVRELLSGNPKVSTPYSLLAITYLHSLANFIVVRTQEIQERRDKHNRIIMAF